MPAIPFRLRFFFAHLGISALLIGACVAFILLVWYPGGLARLEGVYDILLVMAFVDVAAGPLCTLVVATPNKSRRELTRDLAIIGGIQLLALSYAAFTTGISRPAFVVMSFSQFEITRASQLKKDELALASDPQFDHAPWLGPRYVEAVLPNDKALAEALVIATLRGQTPLKDQPQFYQAWPAPDTRQRMRIKRVSDLWDKGELRPAANRLLQAQGIAETDALVLPIYGQSGRGTVVMRANDLAILGVIPDLTP